jgi:hypothetical protein
MVLTKLQSDLKSVNGASLVCDATIWKWVTAMGDISESPSN